MKINLNIRFYKDNNKWFCYCTNLLVIGEGETRSEAASNLISSIVGKIEEENKEDVSYQVNVNF